MLFVNTTGALWPPPVPPENGICTIQSIAVLHTNMVFCSLLNSLGYLVSAARLECDEPAAEAGELIRRQLGNIETEGLGRRAE